VGHDQACGTTDILRTAHGHARRTRAAFTPRACCKRPARRPLPAQREREPDTSARRSPRAPVRIRLLHCHGACDGKKATCNIAGRTMTDLELFGRILGEFLVCERLGVGGHGVVYRCQQRELGREVVVKVLRAKSGDHAGKERFVREARLTSQLEHPFSAHVYAFGVEDDGVRWIAMEFVRGVTLGAYLKARGPMPLAEFVPFFEGIAEVVHAAHERGIVHRDLKPPNVMVIESGGRLLPKLLDFGIAKIFAAAGGSDEEAHEDGGARPRRHHDREAPSRAASGPDSHLVQSRNDPPHAAYFTHRDRPPASSATASDHGVRSIGSLDIYRGHQQP
jgi:serine/threonine protein kinase